ncbi:MAG: hypothetical protein IJ518_05680 [Clostridia bacterium]|nr:hypothetical protein [Clostridia bacterium]
MQSFWGSDVWGTFLLFAVLLGSLLVGNVLKKSIPLMQNSLIPTSVIGGVILIIIAAIYKAITGDVMFDTGFFGGNGTAKLEIITYHALALGFIASTLKNTKSAMNKQRTEEIFNTGVTTVSTYLIQAIVGFGTTMLVALFISGFFSAAGVLLPFGYGQGTGQAMNYGIIYETEFGFDGGKNFGLTIAALGFLSASIGGVIHLNVMKRRGKLKTAADQFGEAQQEAVEGENEIPLSESMDKMTVQIALIAVSYFLSYGMMYLLGMLLPGMKAVIYGFNFLLGVIAAMLVKAIFNLLKKKKIIKREYTNNFLLTRAGNFCFDVMIVSGIAAIRLDIVEKFWGVLILLGVLGTVATYLYNRIVAKVLFPRYMEEQFLMMYGMLTGTASTGIILLREIDGEFRTPASDNMVYQNLPAIVFGFPMMLLATLAPKKPLLTLGIFVVFFVVMNIILFRRQIFRKKKK